MPPKTNTKDRKSKAGADAKRNSKKLAQSVPPSDTWDPAAKPYKNDKKNVDSFFQKELETREQEHLKDVKKTAGIIKTVEKKNHGLLRRQEFEYGMTIDNIDTMRAEIEHIKIQNDKLHAEMVESKSLFDKLEKELDDTKRRYGNAVQNVSNMKRESKTWTDTKERLLRTEERSHQLYTSNRKLRTILLKHKIDPNTDAKLVGIHREHSEEDGSMKSLRSNKTFPRESVRRIFIKQRSDTIEELNKLRADKRKEKKKKAYGFLDGVFDQMNPAYFGYYTRRKKHPPKEKEYYRTGVMLPRIDNRYPLENTYSYF